MKIRRSALPGYVFIKPGASIDESGAPIDSSATLREVTLSFVGVTTPGSITLPVQINTFRSNHRVRVPVQRTACSLPNDIDASDAQEVQSLFVFRGKTGGFRFFLFAELH